MKNFAGRSYER